MAPSIRDNIVFGGELATSVTTPFRSLGHYLLDRYKANADDVMMIDGLSGHQYTRKDVYNRVVRLAYVLQHLGVRSGDVVGLCAENSIEYAVTIFATFVIGATAAPLNVTYSERELDHATNLSKPKVIFCSTGPLSRILTVAKKKEFIQRVVIFGDRSPNSMAIPLTQLLNGKIVSYPDFESPKADKMNDVALIVCSSGTTGLPKGVQLTQMNILGTIDGQLDPEQLQLSGIAILSVIPWFHAFGCLSLILASSMDNTLVFLPKFEEKVFLEAIEQMDLILGGDNLFNNFEDHLENENDEEGVAIRRSERRIYHMPQWNTVNTWDDVDFFRQFRLSTITFFYVLQLVGTNCSIHTHVIVTYCLSSNYWSL